MDEKTPQGPAQDFRDTAALTPAVPPTMAKRVEQRIRELEEQLTAARKMRMLLEKNPDIEELLSLVPRLGLY
jgi:hypothetical protein